MVINCLKLIHHSFIHSLTHSLIHSSTLTFTNFYRNVEATSKF